MFPDQFSVANPLELFSKFYEFIFMVQLDGFEQNKAGVNIFWIYGNSSGTVFFKVKKFYRHWGMNPSRIEVNKHKFVQKVAKVAILK